MQEVETDLAKLTFEEFRARFSTGEGISGQTIQTLEPQYYAPNEDHFSDVFREVGDFLEEIKTDSQNPNITLYGIIGGVDLVLSYIAAVNPNLAVLTDINETAVDYLGSRLDIFKRANTREEYFHILEKENPKAMKKFKEFVDYLPTEERKQIWDFNDEKFNLLKDMVENERIKAFQSDYYNQGQGVINRLIEDSNPDAVVFYLSSMNTFASNRDKVKEKHGGNKEVVNKLLDRNIPFIFVESGVKGNIVMRLYDGQGI